MKRLLIIAALLIISCGLFSQSKYITREGYIWFYSHTPLEDIEAHNRQVNAILDTSTGELVVKVLIKSFEFEKALMQEHFNENYMESDIYPKSAFNGVIKDFDKVDLKENVSNQVTVEGTLSIHGIEHSVVHDGTIQMNNGKIFIKSEITVLLKDYDIKVPSAVIKNIAEEIEINIDLALEPFNR